MEGKLARVSEPSQGERLAARSDLSRTVLALSLIFGGIATMTVIIVLAYFHPAGFEHALFYFGMPLTMLTSGTAQVCILVGLWLLWTVVFRRRLQRPRGWRPVHWDWTGAPNLWVVDAGGQAYTRRRDPSASGPGPVSPA